MGIFPEKNLYEEEFLKALPTLSETDSGSNKNLDLYEDGYIFANESKHFVSDKNSFFLKKLRKKIFLLNLKMKKYFC